MAKAKTVNNKFLIICENNTETATSLHDNKKAAEKQIEIDLAEGHFSENEITLYEVVNTYKVSRPFVLVKK